MTPGELIALLQQHRDKPRVFVRHPKRRQDERVVACEYDPHIDAVILRVSMTGS